MNFLPNHVHLDCEQTASVVSQPSPLLGGACEQSGFRQDNDRLIFKRVVATNEMQYLHMSAIGETAVNVELAEECDIRSNQRIMSMRYYE